MFRKRSTVVLALIMMSFLLSGCLDLGSFGPGDKGPDPDINGKSWSLTASKYETDAAGGNSVTKSISVSSTGSIRYNEKESGKEGGVNWSDQFKKDDFEGFKTLLTKAALLTQKDIYDLDNPCEAPNSDGYTIDFSYDNEDTNRPVPVLAYDSKDTSHFGIYNSSQYFCGKTDAIPEGLHNLLVALYDLVEKYTPKAIDPEKISTACETADDCKVVYLGCCSTQPMFMNVESAAFAESNYKAECSERIACPPINMMLVIPACNEGQCGDGFLPVPVPLPDPEDPEHIDETYDSLIKCSADEDCTMVELGCCDYCNGGRAEAVNKTNVDLVEERYGATCSETYTCTLMACPRLLARCNMDTNKCESYPNPEDFFEFENEE